nr:glycosyltransferase family 2 protein [Bdellovibrio sp. ZAP7]
MSINVLIPMAGAGSRFANAGYKKPKPFIDVMGVPMIERVMNNLKVKDARYILIARKEHLEQERELANKIQQNYNASFVTIDRLTEGAAITVLHARKHINNDSPLLIANSDQIVDVDIQAYVDDMFDRSLDGSIMTFIDNDPKWSYAKLDAKNHVTMVREKEVISDQATVGIYLYKSGKMFVDASIDMITQNDRVNNEFYVCPTYNYCINDGAKIGIYEIDKHKMHGTGTPQDLEVYLKLLKETN